MFVTIRKNNFRIGGLGGKLIWRSLALLLLPLSLTAATTEVSLSWDAVTNTAVAGYKIYYGTASQNYPNVVTVGNVSSATITNLDPGTVYYFVATTYDAAGNESGYSEEVSYTSPQAAALSAVASNPGRFSFTVAGTAGAKYIVQASTNLVDWESIQTNTAPFDFVDENAGNYSQRYYRTATLQ